MARKPMKGLSVLALSMLFCFAGCLGPNHAGGHLAAWNNSFENKWAREGIFLVTLPVRLVYSVGDLLIFNSVQWWTGDNWISRPEAPGHEM